MENYILCDIPVVEVDTMLIDTTYCTATMTATVKGGRTIDIAKTIRDITVIFGQNTITVIIDNVKYITNRSNISLAGIPVPSDDDLRRIPLKVAAVTNKAAHPALDGRNDPHQHDGSSIDATIDGVERTLNDSLAKVISDTNDSIERVINGANIGMFDYLVEDPASIPSPVFGDTAVVTDNTVATPMPVMSYDGGAWVATGEELNVVNGGFIRVTKGYYLTYDILEGEATCYWSEQMQEWQGTGSISIPTATQTSLGIVKGGQSVIVKDDGSLEVFMPRVKYINVTTDGQVMVFFDGLNDRTSFDLGRGETYMVNDYIRIKNLLGNDILGAWNDLGDHLQFIPVTQLDTRALPFQVYLDDWT